MRVSLRQIAKETGVSINTVSQILNRKGTAFYRPETCESVLSAAKRLGYRPNASARFMLTGRFDTVALLQSVGDGNRQISLAFTQAAVARLQNAGLRLILAHVDQAAIAADIPPPVIAEWMTDGFIIDVQPVLHPMVERLTEDPSRPGILVNHRRAFNAVFPDDRAASEALTESMIARGLLPIAYADYSYGLSEEPAHYSEAERRTGWAMTLERHGLPRRIIGEKKPIPRELRHDFSRSWLKTPDRPRAVIVASQSAARAVVVAAFSCGLRVPDDIAVATFAEEPVTDLGVPIDAWIIDRAELGREAANMLVNRLRDSGANQSSRRILGRLSRGFT